MILFKKSASDRAFDLFLVVFLVALITITIYPFWYILCASISNPTALMKHRGIILFPLGKAGIEAFTTVIFKNPNIAMGYRNTLFYLVAGTTINMVMTTLAAYCLSRKGAMLVNPLMMFVTFTMLFQGGMIPSFLLVRNLGWIDSRLALLIPTAISVYNLIIMRTNFQTIPESLFESARLDGAGELTVLIHIVLPLSKAVLAVILLFYSVSQWNSWFAAVLYLRNRSMYPLQLILREILISNSLDSMTTGAGAGDREPLSVTIQYATIIVSTLPILMVYPFLQKYFVKGVMIGAVKG